MQITPISNHRQQRNPNFRGLNVRVDKMYDRVANKLNKYGIQEDTFSSMFENIHNKTSENFSLKFTGITEYLEKKKEFFLTTVNRYGRFTEKIIDVQPLKNPYLNIKGELSMCKHPVEFSTNIPIAKLKENSISELEKNILQSIQQQRDWYNKTMQSLLEQ